MQCVISSLVGTTAPVEVLLVLPEGPILASCLLNPLLKFFNSTYSTLLYSTLHSLQILNSLASFAQVASWLFSESLTYVF